MRATIRHTLEIAAAALACLNIHCANQQPPGGGPKDLAPPSIIETSPANGAVNVQERTISIAFDKYVDRRTVQDAFFISPAMSAKPKFSWSGREVEITLPDTLRANTTYTISLGTDIADVRENVHLAKPFTLTFSSGAHLDSATISGVVYGENTSGVFVFAYRLNDRNPDTLNPSKIPPDFVAPVAKDSTYIVPALPDGTYRLIAIKDEQRNFLYDLGADAFATASQDVVLDPAHRSIGGIRFRLVPPEDTIPPELASADAITSTHVRVTFSEPLDTATITPAHFSIVDTLHNQSLPILSALPSSRRGSVEIFVQAMSGDAGYRCTVDTVRDAVGNMLRSASVTFNGTTLHDTTPPIVALPFRDSTRDIDVGKLVFTADEPLQRKSAEEAVRLTDSTRAQIPLRFRWMNDATMVAYDDHAQGNQWYTLSITPQKFVDAQSNHGRDTVLRIRFHTRDVRSYGSIKGVIEDSSNAGRHGYYVVARNMETKTTMIRRRGEAGAFTIDDLPDGTYLFEAFRDDDGDGVLSPGHIYPHRFAEPNVAVPAQIRVRARWTVEGLVIKF